MAEVDEKNYVVRTRSMTKQADAKFERDLKALNKYGKKQGKREVKKSEYLSFLIDHSNVSPEDFFATR